jgi:hypothetical protein
MLVNTSYHNPEIEKKIDQEVGKPFSLKDRVLLGGIGSPPLEITSASSSIYNLLSLNNDRNRCNLELRPNGVLLRFRARLDSYTLVIPFYKLVLYKGDFAQYSIYRDNHFVKVKADTKAIQKFFTKILEAKASSTPESL